MTSHQQIPPAATVDDVPQEYTTDSNANHYDDQQHGGSYNDEKSIDANALKFHNDTEEGVAHTAASTTTRINTTTATTETVISRTIRNITFAFILVTISLSSGLVYGWPALRRNLLLFENSTLTEPQLGLIFTIGSWSTLGSRLLFGILRDGPFGTRLATLFSLMAVSVGCAGMAFSPKDHVTLLAISYFLVGFGSGTQLCLQPVAGWFEDESQGVVLATTSGAFQVSGLVFWVLVEFVSRDRRVSLGGFAVVLCLVAMVGWRVLPVGQFVGGAMKKSGGHDIDDEEEERRINHDDNDNHSDNNEDRNGGENGLLVATQQAPHDNESGVGVGGGGGGVLSLMKTLEYILLLFWLSLLLIPLQYYVATIGFQLERKGDDNGRYIAFFPIMYASAAIFAPMFGKIADKFGLGIGQGLANTLSILSLVILSVPAKDEDKPALLPLQVLGMTCYGLGRMSVFGTFFSNLGKRFGYRYYGTLAGVGLIVSAVSSLFQYPLIAWAAAGNERWVNLGCAAVLAIQGFPYCVWLYFREKRGCKPGM